MSLFQCENCGCRENTALSRQGTWLFPELFDWSGKKELKGKQLCSVCGPEKYSSGEKTGFGEWHGKFERIFLPKGEFKTNREGNLEHKATGSTNFVEYAINLEERK